MVDREHFPSRKQLLYEISMVPLQVGLVSSYRFMHSDNTFCGRTVTLQHQQIMPLIYWPLAKLPLMLSLPRIIVITLSVLAAPLCVSIEEKEKIGVLVHVYALTMYDCYFRCHQWFQC